MVSILARNASLVRDSTVESGDFEEFVAFFQDTLTQVSSANRLQKKINKYLSTDLWQASYLQQLIEEVNDNSHRICFVGTLNSGKTTIFRQLQWLYKDDTDRWMDEFVRSMAIDNICNSLYYLMRLGDELYHENPKKFNDCKPPDFDATNIKSDEKKDDNDTPKYFIKWKDDKISIVEAIQIISSNRYGGEEILRADEQKKLTMIKAVRILWNQPWIQAVYRNRYGRHYFEDNLEHFVDKIEDYFRPEYVLTNEDKTKNRIRTTGIIKERYSSDTFYGAKGRTQEPFDFQICDMGGARSERRKWGYVFSKHATLIYMVQLSSYAHVLFEDHDSNGYWESIILFDDILSDLGWFRVQPIIVLYNRRDLLKQCIKDGIKLSDCVNIDSKKILGIELPGSNEPDSKFIGTEYDPNECKNMSDDEKEDLINQCVDEAIQFILNRYKYIAQFNGREFNKSLFIHEVSLLDQDRIKNVFERDIMDHIMSSSSPAFERQGQGHGIGLL